MCDGPVAICQVLSQEVRYGAFGISQIKPAEQSAGRFAEMTDGGALWAGLTLKSGRSHELVCPAATENDWRPKVKIFHV